MLSRRRGRWGTRRARALGSLSKAHARAPGEYLRFVADATWAPAAFSGHLARRSAGWRGPIRRSPTLYAERNVGMALDSGQSDRRGRLTDHSAEIATEPVPGLYCRRPRSEG